MKIEKNEFCVKRLQGGSPIQQILNVFKIFEPQVSRQELDVYIALTYLQMPMKADWSRYVLILFNIIQNAVKFNLFKGEIVILLKCLPR